MAVSKLGVKIRRLRTQAGLSQTALAKRAKVTQGFISQLEVGLRQDAQARVMVRLAKALGVPLGELLG